MCLDVCVWVCVCVCVCVCVLSCMCACVRAWVRACMRKSEGGFKGTFSKFDVILFSMSVLGTFQSLMHSYLHIIMKTNYGEEVARKQVENRYRKVLYISRP